MDLLSRLPNDVVVHILSFLPLKQAAATSVLSKRWQHLWKLIVRVRFSPQDVNYNSQLIDSMLSYFEDPSCHHLQELSIEDNRITSRTSAPPFFDAKLEFDDGITTLERWISFALDLHNVHVLSMCIYLYWKLPRCHFPLPSFCNHNYKLTHLKLACCTLQPDFVRFQNLRSVSIYYSSVTDDALESINVNCILLERLELHSVSDLEIVRVSSSLCRLKHLVINDHDYTTRILAIESPSLLSLDFRGRCFDPDQPHHILAPRLKQLTLSFPFDKLSSIFALVRESGVKKVDLSADVYRLRILDHSCNSLLNNLTELRLMGYSLSNLGPLLRASLSLKRLKLSLLRRSRTDMESVLLSLESSSSDGNWKHQNLEKIQIWGFRCTPSHLQMLKYMAELAVGLKRIVITPSNPFWCDNNEDDDEKVGEYIKDVANMLPQEAELAVLPSSNDDTW